MRNTGFCGYIVTPASCCSRIQVQHSSIDRLHTCPRANSTGAGTHLKTTLNKIENNMSHSM